MTFVDFHAHLDFENFDKDRDELIKEMKDKNIFALTNTLNKQNYDYAKKLFEKYDNIKVCPGLYPQDAEKISDKDLQIYIKQIEKEAENIIAIGEVGLDRHHSKDKPELWEIQEERFRKMIELAIRIDKPLIIHTRKAEEKILEILEEYITKTGFKKFDLHCFTGRKRLINKIKELNIYCSIPLIVLNTESFRLLVKELPVHQILVETDSPFLNPDKKRNSPLNVPLIYKEIAKIKGLESKEIENIIYRNYQKITL